MAKETYHMANEIYCTAKERPIVWQKRPIVWQKRPIIWNSASDCNTQLVASKYTVKRDLLYGKRDLLYGKRDLLYNIASRYECVGVHTLLGGECVCVSG
jgi:hypothetical protein